jgi:hypothetical protein
MANDLESPPLMTDSDRTAINDKHRVLEASIPRFSTGDAINAVMQALRFFEDASRNDREQIVASGVLRTKSDAQMSLWICSQYAHLLTLAQATVVRSFNGVHEGKLSPAHGSALTMLIAGHLTKWRKYSGSRIDLNARQSLHQVYLLTERPKLETQPLSVRTHDRMVEATVEALYIRALLLDRFSGGSFTSKQFDILDDWLIAWIDGLWLTRELAPNEAALGIDFRALGRGLTPHVAGDGGQTFLSMRLMQRQLDRAIQAFHLGEIFPNVVATYNTKVDDQVAVIDQIERDIAMVTRAREAALPTTQSRKKRVSLNAHSVVAVFFGFSEICQLAYAPERMNTLVGGGAELGIRNAIRLIDISDGGLGLEMMDEDARLVNIDDLVAIRLEKGKPCVLGVIVRKTTLHHPTATHVGVKVLSKTPLKLTMDRVNDANQWQSCTGILVAGNAADGFGDAVILGELDYVANTLAAATLQGQVFEFFMRRVREHGPGWRMAAIDALEREAL